MIRLRDEVKIYEKDYSPEKVRGKHIAPHTVEVAAMWAVLTRLAPPKHAGLTLLQKLIGCEPKAGGMQLKNECTIEIEGETKPACVAETMSVIYGG